MATPTENASPLSTRTLMGYFIPELIIASILYIVLDLINFRFIACTNVAMCNATIFVTNSILHFITKIAEGFSIGLVIICGQYNGAHEYKKSGQAFVNALFTTAFIGILLALVLYMGAAAIYRLYDVPPAIAKLGVPYLKTRALGELFLFLYFPFVGFLRGLKKPQLPMIFFGLGALVYLFFDYALIFGAWGFPELGLQGSAIASVLQYGTMLLAAIITLLIQHDIHKYAITLFKPIRFSHIKDLMHISWPVMLDKASLALGPIWLNKMIGCVVCSAPEATSELLFDSLTVLKTIERIGLLPAIAFAQVITYVVSNDYKIHLFTRITKNIRKVLIIACGMVLFSLLILNLYPSLFLGLLGVESGVNHYTTAALKLLIALLLLDVFQLILAGSLRGAADVQFVMITRMAAAGIFLIPGTYLIMLLPFDNLFLKFMLLYASIHISKAFMIGSYLYRFYRGTWKQQSIKG